MSRGLGDVYKRQAQEIARTGGTPVLVARDGTFLGGLAVSDPVKADSGPAVARLKEMGLEVVMLTGDHPVTAAAVGAAVGVDQVRAQLLPAEKAEAVQRLQQEGRRVAMVGDGINDAPALAQADVGIAMGSGTDVAMEAGDMVLMGSSLSGVVHALELSTATFKNIRQNLFGALFYNVLGLPIAAGLLYPFFGILLSPVIAGSAMAFSSVTVVSNANLMSTIFDMVGQDRFSQSRFVQWDSLVAVDIVPAIDIDDIVGHQLTLKAILADQIAIVADEDETHRAALSLDDGVGGQGCGEGNQAHIGGQRCIL